jgi:uncharacterized protein (TIGR00299 family) protein
VLWIDATAGVAGDMLLGALVDAGAGLAAVQAVVDAVLPATVRLEACTVTRAGMRALKVDVHVLAEDQPHRTWRDVRRLVVEAELPPEVRGTALTAFELLARAESHVHGVDVDEVHFHEVGAWDSIADVVGVAAAVHLLGVVQVSASPVALGSGRATTDHGDVPVPAPATLQLASGWVVRSGGTGELATPTGLALLRALTASCGDLPSMVVGAIGVGAGSTDTPGRANVVRVVRGTPAGPGRRTPPDPDPDTAGGTEPGHDLQWVLEANIDDLDPRVWPSVLSALLRRGAADAWLTPILMKKGRPAHTLSVLSPPESRTELRHLVLTLTTTFGVREHQVARTTLGRAWRPVTVRGRSMRIKVSLDSDGLIRHATPELDDAVLVADDSGVALRQVLEEAAAAARSSGLVAGEPHVH